MKSQGLLSVLKDLENKKLRVTTCAIKIFLDKSGNQKSKYAEIIDNRSIPATELAAVFKSHNISISKNSIRHHRNRLEKRGCACPVNKK